MSVDNSVQSRIEILDRFTMTYEVSVQALRPDDYFAEFCDFYGIRNRENKLIPFAGSFKEALNELFGDVWEPVYGKTEELFGEPERVMFFENSAGIINELEGKDGLAPFFFVFDLMFCEYGSFTLCFISGTNN